MIKNRSVSDKEKEAISELIKSGVAPTEAVDKVLRKPKARKQKKGSVKVPRTKKVK